MSDWRVIHGDVLDCLRAMEAGSVQTCVTSPPYWGLRDYGHAGQLGLESTPDAYVAKMVEVFGEVRRVLKDDGTLWLNLGDSYTAGAVNRNGMNGSTVTGSKTYGRGCTPDKPMDGFTSDVKPKNLVGIPWRVALALQQPRYTGRIAKEIDRVWLAAMIDGEGCFYVHKRLAGQHSGDGYVRKSDTYSPAFEVANTHKAIVDRCLQIAGCGSVSSQEKDRRQPLWRWTVRSDEARALAREVYPYLVGKQQQCRIICRMPNAGERAEAAWHAMKILHSGNLTDVDFDLPESCFSPGWYLRQDVIWSKPNPMPESVTDRCTKAHEYVFLLAKSERYHFDAEAIREPAAYAGEMRGGSTNRYEQNASGMDCKVYDTRNKRSVWTVNPATYKDAHFATFPPKLIEPCVLAGAPEGGTVLDPFSGSGTTGLVSIQHQRKYIGIELNPEYVAMSNRRLTAASAQGKLFGATA